MTRLEALEDIAARNGGKVTPMQVVDEARNPESVLHDSFEWDDSVAAEQFRLIQAQKLIREFTVTIVSNGEEIEVPAFIGVSSDRCGRSANNPYRRAEDVAKAPDLLEIAEKDALGQLVALRKRHGHLRSLGDVWASIDSHAEK